MAAQQDTDGEQRMNLWDHSGLCKLSDTARWEEIRSQIFTSNEQIHKEDGEKDAEACRNGERSLHSQVASAITTYWKNYHIKLQD